MEFTTIANANKQTNLSYLGNINISSKMIKNKKVNHEYTYLVHLAPASISGYNVCSHSTPECRLGCLATSGHNMVEIFSNKTIIHDARVKKTKLFYEQPEFFMQWVIAEIRMYQNKAKKDGYGFSVRLNGTSDIDYNNVLINGKTIFQLFPEISFYDYSKNPAKFMNKPGNYHLTFSYSGLNWINAKELLERGFNVAIVFNVKKNEKLPNMFAGYKVIDGDVSDLRTVDEKGVIVGLRFKEIADKKASLLLKQKSNFIVQPNDKRCDVNVHELVLN
jgi:hypothetical protein